MASVRIVIADDHRLFAKTLEALVAGEPELEVVGVAEDGVEAIELSATLSPDLVLMDIDMPRLDGLTATARMRELGLSAAVIVLTASDDPAHSQQALSIGAAAYLTKDRVATTLLPTIAKVTGARASLTADGGADFAGRARVG